MSSGMGEMKNINTLVGLLSILTNQEVSQTQTDSHPTECQAGILQMN